MLSKDLKILIEYVGAEKGLLVHTEDEFEQNYSIIEADTIGDHSMSSDIATIKTLIGSSSINETSAARPRSIQGFSFSAINNGKLQAAIGPVIHEEAHMFSILDSGLYLILFFPLHKEFTEPYLLAIRTAMKKISKNIA
jgi:hypothetical protein